MGWSWVVGLVMREGTSRIVGLVKVIYEKISWINDYVLCKKVFCVLYLAYKSVFYIPIYLYVNLCLLQ